MAARRVAVRQSVESSWQGEWCGGCARSKTFSRMRNGTASAGGWWRYSYTRLAELLDRKVHHCDEVLCAHEGAALERGKGMVDRESKKVGETSLANYSSWSVRVSDQTGDGRGRHVLSDIPLYWTAVESGAPAA